MRVDCSHPRTTRASVLPSAEDLRWLFQIDDPMQQIDLLQAIGAREVALTLREYGCAIAVFYH